MMGTAPKSFIVVIAIALAASRPPLGERVPIPRGNTGVSTRAPLPLHREDERRLPRLPEGSR